MKKTRDMGDLLICSMRYSIRRNTGMALIIATHIKTHWNEMRESDQQQLLGEIHRELQMKMNQGNESTWRGLLKHFNYTIDGICGGCEMPIYNCLCSHDN